MKRKSEERFDIHYLIDLQHDETVPMKSFQIRTNGYWFCFQTDQHWNLFIGLREKTRFTILPIGEINKKTDEEISSWRKENFFSFHFDQLHSIHIDRNTFLIFLCLKTKIVFFHRFGKSSFDRQWSLLVSLIDS